MQTKASLSVFYYRSPRSSNLAPRGSACYWLLGVLGGRGRYSVRVNALLPDGSNAKGWYVSLSRARGTIHGYVASLGMHPVERKSVWELVQALQKSKVQSRERIGHNLWAARQAKLSSPAFSEKRGDSRGISVFRRRGLL